MIKRMVRVGLLIVAVLVLATSCKPTEKNYKSAYDAAVGKRAQADAERMLPSEGIMQVDGPEMRVIGGDSVFVLHDRVRTPENSANRLGKFNVAVAFFKMRTNADASASHLISEGYKALAARSAQEKWYVVAGAFPSLEEAVAFYKEFVRKNKSYAYIGLPNAPVIIPGE